MTQKCITLQANNCTIGEAKGTEKQRTIHKTYMKKDPHGEKPKKEKLKDKLKELKGNEQKKKINRGVAPVGNEAKVPGFDGTGLARNREGSTGE